MDPAAQPPPESVAATPRRPSWWRRVLYGGRPRRTLFRLALEVALVVFIFKAVLIPVRISGISMLPAFQDGKINFLWRLEFTRQPLQRGDVVGIRYAGERVMLLKRIIGLPGESLKIEEGTVFIGGAPLEEPYVKLPRARWNLPVIRLTNREYFVIGDNRSMGDRQHEFGAVEAARIVGKVWFK